MNNYSQSNDIISKSYHKVSHPLISVGIICFKLNDLNHSYDSYDKILNRQLDQLDPKYESPFYINKYNNIVNFLLVRRKHSLNYIDFIRGKYELNYNILLKIFNYMSIDEVENIKQKQFSDLWNDLWNKTSYYKKYKNEMNESHKKFDELKQSDIYNKIIASCTPYNTTEWEIPKGRKNTNESNIMCAMREFKEETTLDNTSYTILKCIEPIHDVFSGTNNKIYKHIFYTALGKNNSNTINNTMYNNNEIDEIRWCSWEEAIMLLRSYNMNKINILTNLFMFIINICESNDLKTTL